MRIGNKSFDLSNKCYIMGILNITPDSFSDGGKWNSVEAAKCHVLNMIQDGASIIDVGGESTRPGHKKISVNEEIERVVPIIEMIKKNFDIPVSIDSYKSQVVNEALKAGADMVNDIWGFKYDIKVAELTAKYQKPCCLMHNRKESVYENFLEDVKNDIDESIEIAKKAGVEDDKIILDPGVGFGKTYEQNLTIINYIDCLKKWSYPILLGTSRKSVIGKTLNLPLDQRAEGTIATTVIGVVRGVTFFRVHDVKENIRAVKMTKAILDTYNK